MMKNTEVKITTEYIKLEQFLKIADLVGSGGEAKAFLMSHLIKVNKKEENRRGRKLYVGDVIEIDQKGYVIC